MIDVQDVTIVEVGPRDGLQNESQFIPTENKLELIEICTQSAIGFQWPMIEGIIEVREDLRRSELMLKNALI